MFKIETELTKRMKRGLRGFKPEMPTKMRTIRFAEEVWTPTGIVDVIRFEDYKSRDYSFCSVIDYQRFDKHWQETWKQMHPQQKLGECKIQGCTYPNQHCKGCFWHSRSYDVGMLITCYECKITVQDFKSQNGHNFHGNKNYYVVPKEILSDISPLVPLDIGIIVYNDKTGTYRIAKECVLKQVQEELRTKLLYDALKKWVDKFGSDY